MLKVYNKDTRTTSLKLLMTLSMYLRTAQKRRSKHFLDLLRIISNVSKNISEKKNYVKNHVKNDFHNKKQQRKELPNFKSFQPLKKQLLGKKPYLINFQILAMLYMLFNKQY